MINDLSTYDESTLPILTLPLTIMQKETRKYLGNRYIEDDITLSTSYLAKTQAEIDALYSFWKNDCLSGTKPFILKTNLLGINSENNNLLAFKWVGEFSAPRIFSSIYKGKITLLLKYIVNSSNELIEI